MAPTRQLAALFYDIRARTDGLQKDLKGAEQQFGKLTAFVKANPIAAMTALGTALAGIAIKAAKMASEVETSLRRVGNSVPNGIAGLDKLRDGIASVSRQTGKSQAELARNLQEIAKAGVEGPEEAVVRLKAVQTAVDATGEEFGAVVDGLDQTLDLFGGASEDAARALGTLFAAAKGRTSLTDLFASLQAAAPAINTLKLDLDTAARALVALGEKGLSARQAAGELNRLGEAGEAGRAQIQRLADTIPSAVDGYNDLAKAANEFNNSAEQLNARALAEFQGVMIDLGRAILPGVTRELRNILDLIQRITGSKSKVQAQQGLSDLGKQLANANFDSAEQILGRRAGEFTLAAKQLAKILADGQGEIVATTAEGAEAVAAGVQRLVDVGLLKAEEVKDMLAQLDALGAKVTQAGSTNPLVGGASSGGGPTADELKKQASAAKEAKKEIESLADKLSDLGSVQQLTSGQTTLSARAYADLATEIATARKEFPQFSADIDAMAKRLVELRQAAASFEAADLAREIQELLASFTTSTVDDLELALKRLQERLREKGATDEQIAQVTALEEAFIKVREQSEALDAALANGRQGGITPLREMVQLLDQMAEAERELQALESAGPEHDRERKELLEQIVKLKERIKELEGETETATAKTEEKTRDLVKSMSDVLDVAFGVATALLGANDTLTKMIGAAAQVAGGLESISKLAKDAGGLAKLFSSGAGILSAIPAIGAIIGGGAALGSLIFGKNPEDTKRRKELEENTRALRRLSQNVGDLIGLDLSGQQLGNVRKGNEALLAATGTAGGFRRFGDKGPLRGLDPRKFFEDLGVPFEDVEAVAKQFGIVLNGTKQSYLDLADAIRRADLALFFDTFQGQLDKLDATNAINNITDPIDILLQKAELLAKTSPIFARIFEGLDLSTIAGRAAAVERLRAEWERFMDDPESFRAALEASGLSLEEWKEQMLEMGRVLSDAAIAAARFNEALSDLDLDLEIAGIDDPVARARAAAAAAQSTDERFAPLGGFDLSSAQGRQQAEQFLQGLSIGADDEFKEIIIQILRAIRDIPEDLTTNRPGEVEIVGSGARGLTEVTGNRMADFLRTGLGYQRDTVALLGSINDKIAPLVSAPTPPRVQSPAFSASLGAAPVVSGANTTIVIGKGAVAVTVQGLPGATESTGFDIGDAAARQLVRRLSPLFAEEQRLAARTAGRVVVNG